MLEAALAAAGLAGRPEVKISSFEAKSGRVVYTYETLEYFRRLHPGAPLFFLMGSDCLAGFKGWRRWRAILKSAKLLAGLRPGHSPGRCVPFTPLAGRFPRAASTDLRAALFLGEKPRGLHAPVLQLIGERGLYLGRERELLKKIITPGRYAHSLESARLAVALAPELGLPAQKAALAALLHDCARNMSVPALVKYSLKNAPRTPLLRTLIKEAPVLLHAWAGAERVRTEFGITDPEILEAVRLHATGGPAMGPLARLVYVCDLACPGRTFAEAALVRKLAFSDFAAAFRAANYVKLVYAFSEGGWVHPLSISLWNSLQEKKKG
jgi:nicotinate-nucleotide adenylyltransferase